MIQTTRTAVCMLILLAVCMVCVQTTRVQTIKLNKHKGVAQRGAQLVNTLSRVAAKHGANVQSFPMDGNIYPVGIYWTKIGLGTPPQMFQVAVDSGSSDLYVPSFDCVGCHTQNTGVYEPDHSSTSNVISCSNHTYHCSRCLQDDCGLFSSYQTCNLTDPTQPCSILSRAYSDMYTVGEFKADVTFGAIVNQSLNFQQFYVIDGVIGYAFDTGSAYGGISPFQALVNAGQLEDQFAMCLDDYNGGVLTLGGVDPAYTTSDFQYTPLKKSLGQYILYVLDMTDIQVTHRSIGVSSSVYSANSFGGTVLDSGTNVLLLPSRAFHALEKEIQAQMCPGTQVPGVCTSPGLFSGLGYKYTPNDIAQFPSIQLIVSGVVLNMTGADYIVKNDTTSPYYILGVKNTGTIGALTIIGDTTMQPYYVLFDRKNKRIGWANANREKCRNPPSTSASFDG